MWALYILIAAMVLAGLAAFFLRLDYRAYGLYPERAEAAFTLRFLLWRRSFA